MPDNNPLAGSPAAYPIIASFDDLARHELDRKRNAAEELGLPAEYRYGTLYVGAPQWRQDAALSYRDGSCRIITWRAE